MKILITESQLDKVINNFIGNEFKGIHFVGSIPDRNVYYKYWINDKGRILIAYHPHNGAEVPHSIVKTIMNVFGITVTDALSYIRKWIENNLPEKYFYYPVKVRSTYGK